jgi:hypothetical protein
MYLTAQELPAGGMHGVVASKYLVYRSRSIGRHGRELLTGTRRMSTQASLPWWEGGCTPIHHTVSDWSCLGEEDAGGGAQAATVRALSAARERHAAFRQSFRGFFMLQFDTRPRAAAAAAAMAWQVSVSSVRGRVLSAAEHGCH